MIVTTTYIVTGTTQAGCTGTDSVTITVLPATVAYFGYTINNYTVHFIDSSTNATSWTWFFGDGNLSLSQSPTYTYSADGWYNVQLIVSNGVCEGDTFNLLIPVGAVGIEELTANNDLLIYPNPVSNTVYVACNLNSSGAELKLTNALGEVITVRTISNNAGSQYQEQIDLSNLSAGVYTIQIKSSSQNIVRKFIKK